MRVTDALARIKRVKPNPFKSEDLLVWLNDAEAKVEIEVLGRDPQGIDHYDLPEDLDRELALPKPYDEYYILYVSAQIDFALQEFETYNNTNLMLNSVLQEAQNFYVKERRRGNPLKLNIKL